ncbi:exonuclease V, chloroplastic isoform X2 [Momordica charantia]|uniref:Exonuclease V, chloroplastic isoform X2 n=1 Tax=Momordica charantia TaxID=3673 RepID=A0A6J1CFQ7_MOMCH|nr:exonuclease V, chloroplastic isoform X2 [Momordica charantia]
MAIATVTAPRSPKINYSPDRPKMADSGSGLPPFNDDESTHEGVPNIPVEIVSDEEMALIEAALAAARSSISSSSSSAINSSSSSKILFNARSIQSITLLSKRGLSAAHPDIEDLCKTASTQKRVKVNESLLHRFRRKKGFAVTDFTGTEWCEKQKVFSLHSGSREKTKAVEAGIARHAMLEAEVVKKAKVQVKSAEDRWALKLLNFTFGVNQLLFEGLTRELPVMGLIEGVWMVGVIDEVRMLETDTGRMLMLVDTKTRSRDTVPAEPQQRNGKLQLMCYKYILDSLIPDGFSSRQFFDFFSLNPYSTLSEEITESITSFGFTAKI